MKNIDWKNLPFGYYPTDFNVRCTFKDGKWGEIEISESEEVTLHMASTCLHYGQEAFEGLKAYRCEDGKVRLFRWKENAKRLARSADGVMMQKVPEKLFGDMLKKVVALNHEYIPPYGTGAALYLRPMLIGSGPQIGVKPAGEYTFIIFTTPVGPYFKEGFKPIKIGLIKDSDRAAPLGTGSIKVGGNYAASIKGLDKAHQLGFASGLYLDAKEKKYIDEIGAANFFGIKDGKYITPSSTSILPSITNMSIQVIAKEMGLEVEKRKVPLTELGSFKEVGACGTAAVISAIAEIHDIETGEVYKYCKADDVPEVSHKLYEKLLDIQYGRVEDKWGWIDYVEI